MSDEERDITRSGARDVHAHRVRVRQGGVQRVQAHEVRVVQGGVGVARVTQLKVREGGIGAAVADRAIIKDCAIGVLAARTVRGSNVRVLLTPGAAAALGASFAATMWLLRRVLGRR